MSTTNLFSLRLDRFIQLLNKYFFSRDRLGIRVFESLLDSQRGDRDFCHCSQRFAPFYLETLTTTTDQTTSLLVRSDRLVFGLR